MHRLFCALLLCFTLVSPNLLWGSRFPTSDFLTSRRIVGTINFQDGSAALTLDSRAFIDRIASVLARIDNQKRVVRLEGFCSPDEKSQEPFELSMYRALAVEDYLREFHQLPQKRFLIGFGIPDERIGFEQTGGRVEIALYDNILNLYGVAKD